MVEIFHSPFIVPLGAFIAAIAIVGIGSWKKVREMEVQHDFELRQREMEHELKLKQMDLEIARLKEPQ